LVTDNEISFRLAKRFFKESIIQWYDKFLSEEDKKDEKKYPELKKLYKKFVRKDYIENVFKRKKE
jgi:TorA maturation chaperone TorD